MLEMMSVGVETGIENILGKDSEVRGKEGKETRVKPGRVFGWFCVEFLC